MKLEFSMAADVALVARPPQPTRAAPPARSRTEAGTSSSVVLATQAASRPVGPAGSVGGRPVAVTAVGVLEVILVLFSRFWRTGGAVASAFPDCNLEGG